MLPFTGLDLWWFAGGGALLAGLGMLLSRLARGGGVTATPATARNNAGVSPGYERETEAQYSLH